MAGQLQPLAALEAQRRRRPLGRPWLGGRRARRQLQRHEGAGMQQQSGAVTQRGFRASSALLSLCQLSLGWELPVPLPGPAALLTGGRRRPQRPWGSNSLPPYQKQALRGGFEAARTAAPGKGRAARQLWADRSLQRQHPGPSGQGGWLACRPAARRWMPRTRRG